MPKASGAPPLTIMGWLRRDGILRLAARATPGRVLEIGAGQGAMGWRLANRYPYTAVEPDQRSRAVATTRVATVQPGVRFLATVDGLDRDERFDLVCAFEVLEHIEDDAAAASSWRELLDPGGHLLISVPAHRRRYGPSDIAVGHYRRYDKDDVIELLASSGLEVVELLSYGVGLGHAVEIAWDLALRSGPTDASSIGERTAASGRTFQPRRRLGGAVRAGLALPFRALQRPFEQSTLGVGWLALGHRR